VRSGVTYDAAEAVLYLYGVVGRDIIAADVEQELSRATHSPSLVVRINSSGGSVQEGVAIFNAIRAFPGKRTAEIVGWALSIASHIAMACERILIAENAVMMIHDPWLPDASGNSSELRREADRLDVIRDAFARAYMRSGKSEREIHALMTAETWFDAVSAVREGFADQIMPHDASNPAAMAHAIASFRHCPFPGDQQMVTKVTAAQGVAAPAAAPTNAAAVILAADRQRRVDIRGAFARFIGHDGVAELQTRCEDDPAVSAELASRRLLALLGSQAHSVAGDYVARDPSSWGDTDREATRRRDIREAMAHALMSRNGVPVKAPSPLMRDFQRMSIVDMARTCVDLEGAKPGRQMSGQEVLGYAMHSTSDFPLLLSDTARKSLSKGYSEENGTHVVWTSEREVPDFKQQSIVSLSEAPDLLEIPEHAEYKSGSFGESAETFAVKTYGRIFGLSRQALINDDLEAFTRLPASFGAAARRREADLVYEKLTSAATLSDGQPLFHVSHGNLAAVGAAMSVTTLGAARAAMRVQRGILGDSYVDPQPRVLLVPVALETAAEVLLSSLDVARVGGGTQAVEWIRKLVVVADPRLDDVSATAWYLVADKGGVEGIVRAYLAGEERPFVEDQLEFSRDAWSLKCRLDVGVGVVDFRAFYKNPGA